MVTIRTAATFAGLASALMLAACAAGVPRTAESVVEGQWVDGQGIGISTFAGGQFTTVASDTGNRVSQGTYRFRDSQNIDITMTSLVRQTQLSVSCALATPNQLNCTNSQGTNFVLTRRS